MKTLIVILAVTSLLQATIIPLDLVLIILICRSFIRVAPFNLYLAFAFGLINSHLELRILGPQSFLYLNFIEFTQMLAKSPLSNHPVVIVPLSLVMLTANHLINSILTNQTIQFLPKLAIEGIIVLPIFYLLKLWEERFIVKKDIKLKV